jgi:hypothetical protein
MGGSYKKPWDSLTKLTQIKRPVEKYVMVEETDPRYYNMDSWMPVITSTDISSDPLSIRHNKVSKSCFAFADGHSEQKSWCTEFIRYFRYYEETNTTYGFRLFTPTTTGGKDDLAWLLKGWAKINF